MNGTSLNRDHAALANPNPFYPNTLGSWAATATGFGLVALNRRNTRFAEWRTPPVGEFVSVDGVKLHYVTKGTGPVAVLLHGNGMMLQDWIVSGVLAELAKTHRVIAFDRPGFGYSTRPRSRFWTAQAQASALAAALKTLGVKQASVVGHSLGTLVSLALTLNHPELVSKLTLLSGFYYPAPRLSSLFALPKAVPGLGDLIDHTVAPMMGKALSPLVNSQLFAPHPVPASWTDNFPMDLALRPSQIRAGSADMAMVMASAGAICSRYQELAVPITVIAGASDQIITPLEQTERFHEALPHVRKILLPGAGHMVHHTHSRTVIPAIGVGEEAQLAA